MSAELSQAEIYLLTSPKDQAERFIVEMADEELSRYDLPPFPEADALSEETTVRLIDALPAVADRARREGLLSIDAWVHEYPLPEATIKTLLAVADGEDPTNAPETLTNADAVAGLYGALLIAAGFQGLVLEIFFRHKRNIGADAGA